MDIDMERALDKAVAEAAAEKEEGEKVSEQLKKLMPEHLGFKNISRRFAYAAIVTVPIFLMVGAATGNAQIAAWTAAGVWGMLSVVTQTGTLCMAIAALCMAIAVNVEATKKKRRTSW